MKYKTTKSAVLHGYSTTISIPYCDIQTLLSFENPVAYTTRREGWGADIYEFNNVAIITGYAPFGKIKPSYEIRRKYEENARKIRYDYSLKWEEQKQQLRDMIDEFIKEVANHD